MTPAAPARLFVIPARDVPRAVVFRRGPSAWFHVMMWDLLTDRFEHGAWIKGRIHVERCDLSPDARLLLTFVHQESRGRTSYTSSWTALSRPPWLSALTLWPQGTTYGGGGRFTNNRAAILRCLSLRPHPSHPLGAFEASSGNPPPHASTETVEGAGWAGRGQDGRLIYARDGKLYRRIESRDVEVADWNGLEPDPTPAPAWAREPVKAPPSFLARR
jgi:hypothetical protein